MLYFRVSLLVPPYLRHPKLAIRLRNLATLRIFNYQLFILNLWHCHMVSVPETPVHKYASPVFPHHDVRFPWQSWMIQPIAIPMPPQPTTHHHLRLRIFAVDGRHVRMALFCKNLVHTYTLFATFINCVSPITPNFPNLVCFSLMISRGSQVYFLSSFSMPFRFSRNIR